MAEGKTIDECVSILRKAYESRDSESWIYEHNLDRLLYRTLPPLANIRINTHNREKMVLPKTKTKPKPPKPCFIATAAYASPAAPQVAFLRNIRDNGLRKTRMGDFFLAVSMLYDFGLLFPFSAKIFFSTSSFSDLQ